MTVQIVAARRMLSGRAARGIFGRCALAAIGVSLGAMSISTFGADVATGPSRVKTASSQVMGIGHQPSTVPPSAGPDTELDYLAARGRTIDRLYEQLMHRTSPGCSRASTYASMAGGC
jgi:hypothetical protein